MGAASVESRSMLKLDATDYYDLSEAGRLLLKDPGRLAREARLRKIPSAHIGGEIGLPKPWVDAAAGLTATDEDSMRTYWLARLEPPSPDAHRASRGRSALGDVELLDGDEAAKRVFADAAGLRRLAMDGRLPPIRVDGRPRYDALLTDLVAYEKSDEDAARAAGVRRTQVIEWARFEYTTEDAGASKVVEQLREAYGDERAAGEEAVEPAYEIPTELQLDEIEPLIEADGFETTVDDD